VKHSIPKDSRCPVCGEDSVTTYVNKVTGSRVWKHQKVLSEKPRMQWGKREAVVETIYHEAKK